MSASGIPNLNAFRRGTRGRGRGDADTGFAPLKSRDDIVRCTDDDAATSRTSAVKAGYLDDPFAEHMTTDSYPRRLPLMNRGTYVRTQGIDRIVDTFLASTSEPKQIISLGAGSDTRYFRVKRQHRDLDLVYHELDFRENNEKKLRRLRSPGCASLIKDLCDLDILTTSQTEGAFASPDYHIHSIDLRTLSQQGLPAEIDRGRSTLIISECCLVYLSPDEADTTLSYLSNTFQDTSLAVVIYEPIRPSDAFGKTMIRNLVARGIHLQTIEKYADLPSQKQRLADLGLTAQAEDINSIWSSWISQDEKDRVEKLEWMDEVEEFVLLAQHYCIAWGWRSFQDDPDGGRYQL